MTTESDWVKKATGMHYGYTLAASHNEMGTPTYIDQTARADVLRILLEYFGYEPDSANPEGKC